MKPIKGSTYWNEAWLDRILKLLYDSMHSLDNDFVPGPKFAKLWQEYYDLTGIHEGDEYE